MGSRKMDHLSWNDGANGAKACEKTRSRGSYREYIGRSRSREDEATVESTGTVSSACLIFWDRVKPRREKGEEKRRDAIIFLRAAWKRPGRQIYRPT